MNFSRGPSFATMSDAFKSLKGKLLLDGGKLGGSVFHRSVVLICQHDPQGAFGLVLNRPTDKKVGDVLLGDPRRPCAGNCSTSVARCRRPRSAIFTRMISCRSAT